MSARATPPFRADQVGSLIRPQALIDAREAAKSGAMSPEQLLDIQHVPSARSCACRKRWG